MKIKDVQNIRKEKKLIRINLLTTKSISEWMKKKSISPQKIFDLAIEELINKENE